MFKLDYFINRSQRIIKNYVVDTMYPQLNENSTDTIDDSYNNLKTCLDYRILGYIMYLGDKVKVVKDIKVFNVILVNQNY